MDEAYYRTIVAGVTAGSKCPHCGFDKLGPDDLRIGQCPSCQTTLPGQNMRNFPGDELPGENRGQTRVRTQMEGENPADATAPYAPPQGQPPGMSTVAPYRQTGGPVNTVSPYLGATTPGNCPKCGSTDVTMSSEQSLRDWTQQGGGTTKSTCHNCGNVWRTQSVDREQRRSDNMLAEMGSSSGVPSCPQCNASMAAGGSCPQCGYGKSAAADIIKCPECGYANHFDPKAEDLYAGRDTCANCGMDLNLSPEQRTRHDEALEDRYNPTGEYGPRSRPPYRGAKVFLGAVKEWESATGWFHGEAVEIHDRMVQAQKLRREAAALLDAAHQENDASLAPIIGALAQTEAVLGEHVESLERSAKEYDGSEQREWMENLPGGTVAMEPGDLIEGGLVDIGADDGSFLWSEARRVQKEASEYDWDAFADHHPQEWVAARVEDSPDMLRHEVMTREAAIEYALGKTLVIADVPMRRDIVVRFQAGVERFRREAVRRENAHITAARTANSTRTAEVQSFERTKEILDRSGLLWT